MVFRTNDQSGLNFAMRPDTREGCHYISASKTYLDLLLRALVIFDIFDQLRCRHS